MKKDNYKALEQHNPQIILVPFPIEDFYKNIEKIIKKAVEEINTAEKLQSTKVITVNEAAKIIGICYNTCRKMAFAGILEKTIDGKITEKSVNEYILNKSNNENTD